MQRSSARALKAEILEQVVAPALQREQDRGRLVLSSRSVRKVTGVQSGIALGIARGQGKDNFKLAVRLQSRTLAAELELNEAIERIAKGEVDRRYIGRIASFVTPVPSDLPWHRGRQRPLLIGCSVAHHAVTAGTLGAFPLHRKTNRAVILSNNHVLANVDRGRNGDPILQPGPADGGRRNDAVGELLDFVRLKSRNNLADAAIASIAADVMADTTTLTGLGTLSGVRGQPVEPGDLVQKIGRTTGLTRGTVTAVEVDDVAIDFDGRLLSFDRQIEIEGTDNDPFSLPGDSGSLIVDADLKACALLFAGGDQGGSNGMGLTYANEIDLVLEQLNLELA